VSAAGELAAIMIEPVQNRFPTLQPHAFVQSLREIADQHGCALIFDEVVTGFRLAPGGAQQFYGVRADLCTYGKIIGGGLPFAAIAGKREWMDALDGGFWQYGDDSYPEAGVTYFAGTFVRHPLALAAAKATLLHLKAGGQALVRPHQRPYRSIHQRVSIVPWTSVPRRCARCIAPRCGGSPGTKVRPIRVCSITCCVITACTSTNSSDISSPRSMDEADLQRIERGHSGGSR
jgi:glutamate-1-semialdehyde aminotransferase